MGGSFFPPSGSLVSVALKSFLPRHLCRIQPFVILMSRAVEADVGSTPGPRGESPGWEAVDQRQRSCLSPFSRGVCHLLICRFLLALAKRS